MRLLRINMCTTDIAVLILTACLISIAAVCYAATPGEGSAADFVETFPWLATVIFGLLVAIVGFFLVRTLDNFEAAIRDIKGDLGRTNESLQKTSVKIDATLNTLFDRDREADGKLAAVKSDLAAMGATCRTSREACAEWRQGLNNDRRSGPPRRDDSDRCPPISLEEPT